MNIDAIEKRRLAEQTRLDASKTIEERRLWGQFATPPSLARDIAAATVPFLDGTRPLEMLEPAAGTGAFVSSFLATKETGVTSVTAIERDPEFHRAGEVLWRGFPCRYRLADFTTSTLDQLFDLVVAIPPYVRHHGIDGADKKRMQDAIQAETGIRLSGLAGLYCHFLLLSRKWMRPGAVGVWLIPSEWMSVNYGVAIRQFLSEHVRLPRIHRFDAADVRFSDALVSSCVVWFANAAPADEALFTEGPDILKPLRTSRIQIGTLRRTTKWPPADASSELGGSISRLRDFFTIRRGIATGDNAFFVLSEEKAAILGIPRRFLKPILPSPRHLKTDHVQSDRGGIPTNVPRLLLLDCTGVPAEDLPEAVRAYLASGAKTTGRKKLCASRIHWHDQEQRPPAPFLCSYMGRGNGSGAPVRFILNDSAAIATNSFLMMYPKASLEALVRKDTGALESVWALLRAIPAQEFRRAGRCYGGGLQKMEPRELGDLDVSALADWMAKQSVVYPRPPPEQLLLAMEAKTPYDGKGKRRRRGKDAHTPRL